MTTNRNDQGHGTITAASSTERVLAALQLYGYRPFHDEPDPSCHVAPNCENAPVHAPCCSQFENNLTRNYQICCNNDNGADRWNTEHGRREFTEGRRFSRTVRGDIIGKGNEHFGSRDSTRVMPSDYQIRCSKRTEIIKLSTGYQIKRTAKPLKLKNSDSCI